MLLTKKIRRNPLDTTQTTFSENNNYYRVNIGENKKKSLLKMHLFRGISPKCFLTPQKETGCHIFKMDVLSKFFGDFMSHLIR